MDEQQPPRQAPEDAEKPAADTPPPYDLSRIVFHWANKSSLINGIPSDEYIQGRYYPYVNRDKQR